MGIDRETKAGLWLLSGLFFYFAPLIVLAICYFFYGIKGTELRDILFSSAFILWIIGQWMIVRSKRLDALTAEEAILKDPRPPVLYIRSFKADISDGRKRSFNLFWRAKGGVPLSEEEELTKLMSQIGPVIAIGRPGEKLPQLGAARVYVADDQWQYTVKNYMDQCRLVLIRAGETPGLQWELNEIVHRMPPEKVFIYFPKKIKFAKFRQWANAVLPIPLPEQWPIDSVVFNENWEPSVPLAAWWEWHGVEVGKG